MELKLSVFDCCDGSAKNSLETFKNYMSYSTEDFLDLCIEICGKSYHPAFLLEEVDVIIGIICKNWFYIQHIVLNEEIVASTELINTRTMINRCLKAFLRSVISCENGSLKEKYLKSCIVEIKKLLAKTLPINELEKDICPKLTASSTRKSVCPIYHYFHTYQDVNFYLLLYYYLSGNLAALEQHTERVLRDLVWVSENVFKHNNKTFVCDCHKDFYLIIQLLCEKVGEDVFWAMFNKTVQQVCNQCAVAKLLEDIALLQSRERIKPNFILLESVLKNVTKNNTEQKTILPVLKAAEPLVSTLWLKSSKIEIHQVLWDYFSKNLNSSRPNINLKLSELVDVIDNVLWAPKDVEVDFELFVSMLCCHLKEHPYHWSKIKGRIYSQLGPNKLKDLSNSGIFNVLLLFLALLNVNFEELAKKFLQFVEGLPMEKKQTQLIWTFYSAFVVRHLRENRDIAPITFLLTKMLEAASTDQKSFHLLKSFVNDFDSILNSTANLQLHQWLLINTWIHKYMSTCHYQDSVTLLKILLNTLEKIQREHSWCEWEQSFRNYVYPALKYTRSIPEISGSVAARIATLSPSLMSDAFAFFTSDSMNPKVSAKFLGVVLESSTLSEHQEVVVLQTWTKFCLLNKENHEEFTRSVLKFDSIPQFLKMALENAPDPLCALIDCISSDITVHKQSPSIVKLCDTLFSPMERWIQQYFMQPDNEPTVLRIYTVTAVMFSKIGLLLYDKHKSNCTFARIISALLLPKELIMGKPLHSFILQSIKKSWHVFFQATVKIYTPNDAFLDRILREMIVRYIPHFTTANSPMLKCLENAQTAPVFLQKMSETFFRQSAKEAESSILKSLNLLNDFLQSSTSQVFVKVLVNKTLYGLFELVMFNNQRNVALNLIKNIVTSPYYLTVKCDIEETVMSVTEKHLAFNTPNYFQLLGHLAKMMPSSLKSLVPRIRQHVSKVEGMRGVGYDKNLRLSLERLEAGLFY